MTSPAQPADTGGPSSPSPPASVNRAQVIDVPDTEAALETLSAGYMNMRIQARGRPRGMRLASVGFGPARFDRLELRMAFHADVAPLQRYAFGQVLAGRVTYTSGGIDRQYRTGDVFLSVQPDLPFTASVEDSSYALAVIDSSVIEQVTHTEPGRSEPVRFTAYQPFSRAAARTWTSTYAFLSDDLAADPAAMAYPLVAGSAARLLMATALAVFPNTARTEPTIEDRHDAHPATLRRAIAFIDSHADRDITAADIARAAGVTVRAVQLAFRRHLDTTPMTYLRRVRLDYARADLHAAIPGRDTVTDIAARWGYGRASVFAARYRAIYGETPFCTLRST